MTRPLLALASLLIAGPVSAQAPPAADLAAFIDGKLDAAWKAAGVKPAREIDDAEYLRRVTLDLTGVIPEEEAARAFLRAKGNDRRARLVRGLLYGQGYARSMGNRWANLLIGRQRVLETGGETSPLVLWLAQQLAANTPWDEVVRRLVAAEGTLEDNGAVAWLLTYDGRPEEATGNALRVFCGIDVQCAQCHDHPFDPTVKQRDFWGLAAFFARAGSKQEMDKPALREKGDGEVRIPAMAGMRHGPVVAPRFLGAAEDLPLDRDTHRRKELARLLTAPQHRPFALATVDRFWGFFFGEPLVKSGGGGPQPLVDLRELLAVELLKSGHDVRRLCEAIVLTKAYQRAAAGDPKAKTAQQALFARARLRPLPPEQLWSSLERAVALESYGAGTPEEKEQRRKDWRAQFFRTFAGDESTGEGEQATVPQALALINGPLTNEILKAGPESVFLKQLMAMAADERLESLFLRVLSRPPTSGEKRALIEGGRSSQQELTQTQDILWGLLNSSEFLYNH